MSESYFEKNYEELGFTDYFMFGKVMEDPKLCHDVLECLLQKPVDEIIDNQRDDDSCQSGTTFLSLADNVPEIYGQRS